ncbi:MAG: hypothetical protein ABSA11_13360 [Candidatus Bathyarchaeia archaeon]
MVKLLDIEISAARLTLRAIIAILLSVFSLAALYILPRALIDYTSTEIPNAQLLALINQLLDPRIPTLGILASLLVLATMMLRKTKLEGPFLILLGASLITYSYVLLHGGTIDIQIPVTQIQSALEINIPMSIQANLSLNITTLMLTSMCPPLLIIVKGTLLAVSHLRKA